MRYSPLNPPPELLTVLESVVDGIIAVRAQMHSLQAAESLLLQTGEMLAQQMASVGTGRKSTGSALNMAYRTVQTEIGAAVHEYDRTVAVKMGRASELVEKYPAVYRALARGEVSGAHANAIVDAGEIIENEEARGSFEAEALEFAEAESVSRLRPLAKQLAEKYSGEQRTERYQRARAQRRVFVIERDDGMADLTAHLPAPYAYGIKDRLDQMAHNELDGRRSDERNSAERYSAERYSAEGSRAEGATTGASEGAQGVVPTVEAPIDNRTADQLRADMFTDMLLASDFDRLRTSGAPASGFKARVQVIVPLRRIRRGAATQNRNQRPVDDLSGALFDDLLGGSDGSDGLECSDGLESLAGPGDLARSDVSSATQNAASYGLNDVATLEGYGPISDEDAADIAANAACWEKVTVDADTGTVLKVDTYRPSAELRRFLGARDLHCRFPGCRAALAWCDIDHTIDAAFGGSTSSDNLGHLCRRHHTLKHASPWTVAQDEHGVYIWISPTGRRYTDTPESNVRFREIVAAEGTSVSNVRTKRAAERGRVAQIKDQSLTRESGAGPESGPRIDAGAEAGFEPGFGPRTGPRFRPGSNPSNPSNPSNLSTPSKSAGGGLREGSVGSGAGVSSRADGEPGEGLNTGDAAASRAGNAAHEARKDGGESSGDAWGLPF